MNRPPGPNVPHSLEASRRPQGARPRIGVDFHTFDGIFQGSRSHLLGLYGEVISLAPEFDFIFLLAEPERLQRERPQFAVPNVRCVKLPQARPLVRLGWQLAAMQRRHRFNLLHMQYRLPLWPTGPCVCTVHDTLFESHPEFFGKGFVRMARWTGRRAVRDAALLFTVSQYSRAEMSRLYGVDPQCIAVTVNGVDRTRFFPGTQGAGQVRALGLVPGGYLCTVGRLEPRKNHLTLLQAYAKLPRPRPPLVVIGQRDFSHGPVFEAVHTLGLESEVRFMESLEDAAVPVLIRHALLFVYPSFAEGFGMPVVEAMASGVAVVTSSTTSLPEVAGDAALMVDPTRVNDLTRAMSTLLSDATLRNTLAQRGITQAARFNWRDSALVLVQRYRRYFGLGSGADDGDAAALAAPLADARRLKCRMH
jgi:glycosyltransferase involved in cell wall biosynthesis